jgi:hypothetical protein
MRQFSKYLSVITLAAILSSTPAQARPTEDPGRELKPSLISRIVKAVKQIIRISPTDDLSVPHP